jgi:hypothetical protein
MEEEEEAGEEGVAWEGEDGACGEWVDRDPTVECGEEAR